MRRSIQGTGKQSDPSHLLSEQSDTSVPIKLSPTGKKAWVISIGNSEDNSQPHTKGITFDNLFDTKESSLNNEEVADSCNLVDDVVDKIDCRKEEAYSISAESFATTKIFNDPLIKAKAETVKTLASTRKVLVAEIKFSQSQINEKTNQLKLISKLLLNSELSEAEGEKQTSQKENEIGFLSSHISNYLLPQLSATEKKLNEACAVLRNAISVYIQQENLKRAIERQEKHSDLTSSKQIQNRELDVDRKLKELFDLSEKFYFDQTKRASRRKTEHKLQEQQQKANQARKEKSIQKESASKQLQKSQAALPSNSKISQSALWKTGTPVARIPKPTIKRRQAPKL